MTFVPGGRSFPQALIPSFVILLPPRQGNCSRSSPHSNGSESTERFSRKVFVGGLPPDIDEGKCSCFDIVPHSIEHERNTCFNLHVRTHTHLNPELRGEIWTRRLSSGTCVPGHAPAKSVHCELGEMEIHFLLLQILLESMWSFITTIYFFGCCPTENCICASNRSVTLYLFEIGISEQFRVSTFEADRKSNLIFSNCDNFWDGVEGGQLWL